MTRKRKRYADYGLTRVFLNAPKPKTSKQPPGAPPKQVDR